MIGRTPCISLSVVHVISDPRIVMHHTIYLSIHDIQGMILPSRTWCFIAEIVSDALSQESVLGHRVEVRDLAGDIRSILFYPDQQAPYFDWRQLRTGSTILVRYAQTPEGPVVVSPDFDHVT